MDGHGWIMMHLLMPLFITYPYAVQSYDDFQKR